MSAYVFRIHEASKPTDTQNVHGWAKTGFISGSLLNNIKIGTVNSKMGTSIPSLFARLYLFEGAFQALQGSSIYELQASNNNTSLISECFDLLEFLFQRGNDRNLVVRRWNADQQIQLLKTDLDVRHTRLAKVIEDEVDLHPQFKNLYLFYWKTPINATSIAPQELLIGGASPLTMVFTSPNWKRIIKEKGLSFSRLNGKPSFSDNFPEPLNKRDESFKRMIYCTFMAYHKSLANVCPSFESYIQTCWANEQQQDPRVQAFGGNPTIFLAEYPSIKDENGAAVFIGGVPLAYEQITADGSGYQIRCTSDRYATYNYKGTQVTIDRKPLVLNEHGKNGAPYVGSSRWDSQTCFINDAAVRGVPLHERHLPGQMGIKAPYVIWSDFLEDKIIKTSYVIDDLHFVTATNDDLCYLLPLKKEFFNFFNIEDITKVVSIEGNRQLHLLEINQNENSVEVTLNIPIEFNHSTIELKKIYQGDAIIEDCDFILGCFPFYKITDNNQLNKYSVLNCGNSSEINFFKLNSVSTPVACNSMVRTPRGAMIQQTKYYDVNESFDFIRVSVTPKQGESAANGLVIPIFKEISTAMAANHYSFSVDFGTSNTYIAYNTQLHPIPVTLEYSEQDAQSVLLNKGTVSPSLQPMFQYFNREFAPSELGSNKDFSLPTRTATCETPSFEKNVATLFGNISIGFNFMNEVVIGKSPFVYKTELKWALEANPDDANSRDRVRNFFLQLLWMMKNKALLNDGDARFDLFITFPESMKVPTKNLFVNQCWKWASQELGLDGCNVHYGPSVSESIAPYNKLAPVIGGSDLINIDIGGGTSDILIVTKHNGMVDKAYYCSTKFAADDLWGDGLNVGIQLAPKNGFLKYIKGKIDSSRTSYDSGIIGKLDTILNLTNSSADAMGFLFKNDSIFGTSNLIATQSNLYSLVFIHYSALMYYIARVINKLNISIPENISFTGMGSRYINLISTNVVDVLGLTKLLLETYTGKTAPLHFKIFMESESKEVTAKGALMGEKLDSAFQIPNGQLHKCVDYGFDTDKEMTYGEVTEDVVKSSVISEYERFVASLRKKEIANYLYHKFGLSISASLLDALVAYAVSSYENMCASIPAVHAELDIEETLFFWPLKLALPVISENYEVY